MTQIGFTGTQAGMTEPQAAAVVTVVRELATKFVAHHGDCIGADADFHKICVALPGCRHVVIYPPVNPSKRAFCDRLPRPEMVGLTVRPEREYLARNKDIVRAAQWMVATPREYMEQARSGTWATIRHVRKRRLPLVLVYPTGEIQYEAWPSKKCTSPLALS